MLFAVIEERFNEWDFARDMREQERWAEHAAFMDELTAAGFIQLGGPLGDDARRVLLVVEADDEAAVKARFAGDPWLGSHLRIASIERWEVLLGAPRAR